MIHKAVMGTEKKHNQTSRNGTGLKKDDGGKDCYFVAGVVKKALEKKRRRIKNVNMVKSQIAKLAR